LPPKAQSGHYTRKVITIAPRGPYNLALSLKVAASFSPQPENVSREFIAPVRVHGRPALVEVQQTRQHPPLLAVNSPTSPISIELRRLAEWMLFLDLDLRPFYAVARRHPVLGPVVNALYGTKPLRPPTLFEMAVTALSEQQISLAAAYRIRERLIQRFGDRIDDRWAFPLPVTLARARIRSLTSVGLSRMKATYVHDLAAQIVAKSLDLEALLDMSDADALAYLDRIRGFGRWSADYILVRGLARLDCVPTGDLAVRRVVTRWLGKNARPPGSDVMELLRPFKPYRGLAVFYLLAHDRVQARSAKIASS
jgi:DNA-3-methyladenine glycosylase II